MTEFEYGDIVKCIKADDTRTGPLKEDGLYVVEAVANHGKSIRVAGDWHRIKRFELVGKSDLKQEHPDVVLKKRMNVSLGRLNECANNLSSAFVWNASEEGEHYWREVSNKLVGYLDRFEYI